MNVLVACETSGVVRRAFAENGRYVRSCDLLPSEDTSPNHLICDAHKAITESRWDLIIMHPPCTALAVSGNRWYGKGMPQHEKRLNAIEWTMNLWEVAKRNASSVCMENPVGVLPMKATQYIQPWQFGHPHSKKTGLWLYDLPKLEPTEVLPRPECSYWENQTPSGQNKLGPSSTRSQERARTYEGIGKAMATQWT